ncbi:unnamed protein product, partial [Prorocentrum cordatum]
WCPWSWQPQREHLCKTRRRAAMRGGARGAPRAWGPVALAGGTARERRGRRRHGRLTRRGRAGGTGEGIRGQILRRGSTKGHGDARIVTRFQDVSATPLHASARTMIKEHLADVYDFQRGAPKDKALGEWLSVMSKLLRMLRSTAVANITITSVHRAPAAR